MNDAEKICDIVSAVLCEFDSQLRIMKKEMVKIATNEFKKRGFYTGEKHIHIGAGYDDMPTAEWLLMSHQLKYHINGLLGVGSDYKGYEEETIVKR